MLYRVLCVCAALALAGTVNAQTLVEKKDGVAPRPPQVGDGDASNNMFNVINKVLAENPEKLKATQPGAKSKVAEYTSQYATPRNLVPSSAAALCPICREKLARHSDPDFKCAPVDADGKPIPMAEIVWLRGACPVCNSMFRGALPGNINAKAGVDRDFCLHSIGRSSTNSNVWACPDCGYAAFIESFGQTWDKKPITDETREFVRREIRPTMFKRMCKLTGIKEEAINKRDPNGMKNFAEILMQDDLQLGHDPLSDWIKYDNAIKIYKMQKAPHALMARLYLEGAYACRREVNGEIAVPALIIEIEQKIGVSIRRINHDITAATILIRQERNQNALIDPNKAEIDPALLADAAEMILKMGELTGDRIRAMSRDRNGAVDRNSFYTNLDMFVLRVRCAGILDRLGKFDAAARNLDQAKSIIDMARQTSEELTDRTMEKTETVKFVNKQLDQIQAYVDVRLKCLEFEREWLSRAMWENMVAIHNKTVRFTNPGNLLGSNEKDQFDPAMTAYYIGELARRCSERGTAIAFLAATDAILVRQLTELAKEEDYLASNKEAPESKTALEKAKKLGERWNILRSWNTEQLKDALVVRKEEPAPKPLKEEEKKVLDLILQGAGIDPAAFKIPQPTAAPVAAETTPAAPKVTVKAVTPKVAAAAGEIKTREDLFKMYFKAITQYVKEKKSNPPDLKAIVNAGYVSPENASLSESSTMLVCPESREMIQYVRSFELGNRTSPMLFQTTNTKAKMLFGNGEIRTLLDK